MSGYDGILDKIISYEQGELDTEQNVEFFQNLVDTGLAALIEAGLVTP